jgi:hypothetical protein
VEEDMRRITDMFNSDDFFPTIESAILSGVPTFRTKTEAMKAGSKFGLRCALKVARRFETIWIVGKIDFQDSYENGIPFQCLRLPLLKFENNMQRVLVLRRPSKR